MMKAGEQTESLLSKHTGRPLWGLPRRMLGEPPPAATDMLHLLNRSRGVLHDYSNTTPHVT